MRQRRFSPSGSGGFDFGGMRLGPGLPLTPAVKGLLLANVAVFVLSRLPGVDTLQVDFTFGLVPAQVFGEGHVWQLFTYMFLHGGLWHIGANMLMLWMFGTTLAHQWGDRDFLIYYFVCGLGGALASWLSAPNALGVTIGASAGVIGILVAYALMYPDRRVLFMMVFPMKMKYLMYGILTVELLAGLSRLETGVAHFAHLGGAAAGWIYLRQDWRLNAFSRKLRGQRARAKMAQNAQRAGRASAAGQAEVNRILEKISSEGIESLTPAERDVLRDASRH